MPLPSSLLPHLAQLAPGRKHQQEENPQPVHNKQRIWASRLWGWFLMGDQIVREFKTFFQEEETSLRTLAAKISLPMWSTQSDCGGDQHEIFSILDIFLQMSEMRLNEIMASTSRRPTFYMINYILPAILINVSILKQQTNVPRMIPGDLPLCLYDAQWLRGENNAWHLSDVEYDGEEYKVCLCKLNEWVKITFLRRWRFS